MNNHENESAEEKRQALWEKLHVEAGEPNSGEKLKYNNFYTYFSKTGLARNVSKEVGSWNVIEKDWYEKSGIKVRSGNHSDLRMSQTGEQFFDTLDRVVAEVLSPEEYADFQIILTDPKEVFWHHTKVTTRFNRYLDKIAQRMHELGYIDGDFVR